MGVAVVLAKSYLPLVVAIALGGVTYPALILAFRAFSIPEARSLLSRAFKRAV
jgi:hypothetical protein